MLGHFNHVRKGRFCVEKNCTSFILIVCKPAICLLSPFEAFCELTLCDVQPCKWHKLFQLIVIVQS